MTNLQTLLQSLVYIGKSNFSHTIAPKILQCIKCNYVKSNYLDIKD